MYSKFDIDVRIAIFFRRAFNYYIKKRTYMPPPPTQDEIWQSLFKANDYLIHQLDEQIQIRLYKDSILAKLIFFGFEKAEIAFLKRFLKAGDTFIDIGSNIGFFSLYASQIVGNSGKIYAFEPTPTTYERLLENISLNSFSNIEALNLALSNKVGEAIFNISNNGHDAWNSFAEINQIKLQDKIKVKVEKLDTFIENFKLGQIALIKLDVEGWEKYVLEGANSLLIRDDAPTFLIEFTEDNAFAAGYYCGELFDYMKLYGYNWYSYNMDLNKIDLVEKKLHYPYENLIATKNVNTCTSRIRNIS